MKKIKDEDMIWKRFGRLVVIEREKDQYLPSGEHHDMWICKCDCGNIKAVAGRHLRTEKTKSCGCIVKEGIRKQHGKTHTRIHNIWCGMNKRCNYKGDINYKNYGGRGIVVCEEWKKFENFYSWSMNNGYTDELTIDRIDVNGNYCPENCRWATYKEQANNTRKSRFITYNGETHTTSEWEDITGIKSGLIRERLDARGWSVERALTEKPRICKRRNI